MQIISIEGNIGSGKSTFLAYIKANYNNVIYLREPVTDWMTIKDENNITILENFYNDQQKYAFEFQILTFQSRTQIMLDAIKENPDAIIITERSLCTDNYVFAKMMHENGNITTMQYQIYKNMYDYYIKQCRPTTILYIDTKPEICAERILKRNREGENIQISYLQNCDKYHKLMLENEQIETININGDNDFNQELYKYWDSILNAVLK